MKVSFGFLERAGDTGESGYDMNLPRIYLPYRMDGGNPTRRTDNSACLKPDSASYWSIERWDVGPWGGMRLIR